MTFQEFSESLNIVSVGRVGEVENERLLERMWVGMIRLAYDVVSTNWLVTEAKDNNILRRVDANSFIRKPDKPTITEDEQIDIEDNLIQALRLLVMASIEEQRRKTLMHNYYVEIENYTQAKIEIYLEGATNDSQRFHRF